MLKDWIDWQNSNILVFHSASRCSHTDACKAALSHIDEQNKENMNFTSFTLTCKLGVKRNPAVNAVVNVHLYPHYSASYN